MADVFLFLLTGVNESLWKSNREKEMRPQFLRCSLKNKGTVVVDFLYQPARIGNVGELSLGVSVTVRVFPETFN